MKKLLINAKELIMQGCCLQLKFEVMIVHGGLCTLRKIKSEQSQSKLF